MVITTDAELLQSIHELYGHSIGSQKDLAKELEVSVRAASYLTQAAGYHRHKLKDSTPVLLDDFIKKPYVEFIIKKKGLKKYEEKS